MNSQVRAGRHIPAQTMNIHLNSGKSQLLKIKVSGWLNPSGLQDSLLKDPHQQHTIFGGERVKQDRIGAGGGGSERGGSREEVMEGISIRTHQ